MSFNVSALSTYTDQLSGELITKAVLMGNTPKIVTVVPGIKSSQTINKLQSSTFLTLGSCGFLNSGSTDLSQTTVTVVAMKENLSFCLETLDQYYLQTKMKPGSYPEALPIEGAFAEDKAKQLSKAIDIALWQGNKSTGTGNNALFDGFIKYIDNNSGSTVNIANTAITSSNGVAVIDAMVAKIPSDIVGLDNLTAFLSPAEFQNYLIDLRNKNYFHYTADFDFEAGINHPGTSVRVRPITGLQGSTRKFIAPADVFVIGTDMLSDYESFKMWWSDDNQEVRYVAKFKLGVAISWLDFVVNAY